MPFGSREKPWLSRLFNPLIQQCGLVESLDGGKNNKKSSDDNDNKHNIVAAMMVNINEDIFLYDKS